VVCPDLSNLEELLADGYEAQADCYRMAVDLMRPYLDQAREVDPEALLAALDRQQALIVQAAEIDQTLETAKARWHQKGALPGARLKRALDRTQQYIGELVQINEFLQEALDDARRQLRTQLDEMARQQQAGASYQAARAERPRPRLSSAEA
jgi:hypothetical protein